MKTISVLAYNRPHYLKQCLEALAKCRGVQDYVVIVSHDGPDTMPLSQIGDTGLQAIEIAQQENLGIDHHNKVIYDLAFKHVGSDFHIALEDDAVLTPDALELAEWFYNHPHRDGYRYLNLGDPKYSTAESVVFSKGRVVPDRALYSSAWCFTKKSWSLMRDVWNCRLLTQKGWDWSLSYHMSDTWVALSPELSRVKNVGREGVHSYPEFFDANIAGAVVSNGEPTKDYYIDSVEPHPLGDWWMKEKEAQDAQERNK